MKKPEVGDYVSARVADLECGDGWKMVMGTVTDVLAKQFIIRELPDTYPHFVMLTDKWEVV